MAQFIRRFVQVVDWVGMALLPLCLGATAAHAQSWPNENGFTRQVVYATCGKPQIPVEDICLCGGLLAYDDDKDAGLLVTCGPRDVPNLIHRDMSTNQMLQFLITTYYGALDDFCEDARPDGGCGLERAVSGIGANPRDEPYYVGHFTSILLGEERCMRASRRADPSEWSQGPFIGELDLTLLSTPNWQDRFQAGCRNDYRDVLAWLETR